MKSTLETTTETNLTPPALRNSTKIPARIAELIEQRNKAIAEATKIQRMIDHEALRLEKEAIREERWKARDWTAQYTGQKYRILSAIWYAPKRRLTTEKIEAAGWHNRKTLVSRDTFQSALTRIKKKLRADKCPYNLVSIRSRKTGEVMGYGLRKCKSVQKVQK